MAYGARHGDMSLSQTLFSEEARTEALRAAGQSWPAGVETPDMSAGVSSDLVSIEAVPGTHIGDTYVRVVRAGRGTFRSGGPGAVRATAAVPRARGPLGRLI